MTLPMNFELHRERCDAVTLSLRSSLLKGLGSPFTESHAPCTTCWKPSTFVQKDWNWNLRPLYRLGANRRTKGQWSDRPEEIAERKASGSNSSHSTFETTRSSLSRVGFCLSLDHKKRLPLRYMSFNSRHARVRLKQPISPLWSTPWFLSSGSVMRLKSPATIHGPT